MPDHNIQGELEIVGLGRVARLKAGPGPCVGEWVTIRAVMLLTNLREVLQCPEKAPWPSCCLQVLSQSQLRHYAKWAFKHKNWDADAMIIKDGRFGWQRFIKPGHRANFAMVCWSSTGEWVTMVFWLQISAANCSNDTCQLHNSPKRLLLYDTSPLWVFEIED